MRFWFDTEFIEDGKTIDLISIGIAAEDGREFYAQNGNCDLNRASAWVKDNVFPHLKMGPREWMPRWAIAESITEFVGSKPEFWAYYADYDWVVLCQLYGTMMNLPKGWPMYCRDLKQLLDDRGNPRQEKQQDEHNALADAKWCMAVWKELQR